MFTETLDNTAPSAPSFGKTSVFSLETVSATTGHRAARDTALENRSERRFLTLAVDSGVFRGGQGA